MRSFREQPEWYNALTVTERAQALRGLTVDLDGEAAIAERRLQRWKTQAPFQRQSCLHERLAQDAITEDQFRDLLGASPETLRQALQEPPDWLVELERAWNQPSSAATDSHIQDPNGLLAVVRPLLASAIQRLTDGISELQKQHERPPFAVSAAIESCVKNLSGQLGPMITRAMVLELNAARLRGQLVGDTSEARFQDFLHSFTDDAVSLAFLKEYPVLARQLLLRTDFTVRYSVDFLSHLCSDWSRIKAAFPKADAAGALLSFASGAGDTHNQGRSVCIATFESEFKLVYKPHSMAVDVHYHELLDWCNQHGFEVPFRPLRILDCGSHGWSEFAVTGPCESRAEVERFYFRLGGQMALLYALNANDFHCENVLACGEHPALVDLETLFHPSLPVPEEMRATRFARQLMEDSVLRTHLLPQQVWLNSDLEGVDISGLSAREGQTLPFLVAQPEAAGTDEMRFVKQKSPLPASRNRPRLGDEAVNALHYTKEIESGFISMYRLLEQNKTELLSDPGPLMAFANDPVRVVLRPTHTYGQIYHESFHPALLRNATERDRLIDKLWLEIERQPCCKQTIPYERRDLLRGDIPYFSATPGGCHLYASDGECLGNFFPESALHAVRRRLTGMSQSRLQKQIELIRYSLATLEDARSMPPAGKVPPADHSAKPMRERLMQAACRMGDRLLDLAWTNDEGDLATWVGLVSIGEKSWSVMPAGLDLYNGLPGPALFLGYLGAMTEERRYTDKARSALTLAWHQAQELRASLPEIKAGIGAFGGDSGMIYVLGQLGRLWNDSELLQRAEQETQLLHQGIAEDKSFDMISGSAGCICVMDALYAVTGSDAALAVARSCGDHLIQTASPQKCGLGWMSSIRAPQPLTGFSHGVAGIAYALLRLFHRTGDERYKETALAAIEYERSQFLPAEKNWRDWRIMPGDDENTPPRTLVAWCHGAPGIGMGRIAALPWHEDALTAAEIETAVRTTVAHGFGGTHALCHGDLGNLELLLLGARRESHVSALCREQLDRLTGQILSAIEQTGWLCATPSSLESAGFMIGMAGIGYSLLRLANPESVPSVLLLSGSTFQNTFLKHALVQGPKALSASCIFCQKSPAAGVHMPKERKSDNQRYS